MEDSVADLAVRARAGDRAAFRRLYERFAPRVHALLVAGARADEADDLMQQVFFASWRALERLREPERFGSWVTGIARNHVRRHHARRALPTVPLPEGCAASEPAQGGASAEMVLGALRSLPEAYRETLALRLIEGLAPAEIADTCGLTAGSVRVNLTRGMKLLRAELEREGLR